MIEIAVYIQLNKYLSFELVIQINITFTSTCPLILYLQ